MIVITISTAALERALTHLEWAGRNLTTAFKDIGETLINSTRDRFEESRGPDGARWAENRPVTLARKKGAKPLIGETRLLATEIHYDAGRTHVVVGSSKEYAAMQQFGGQKSAFGHLWGDIPARPFVGLSKADEEEVLDTIVRHLKTAAGV
ncbi:phage virion morphogenesis protein [Verminephrobacter aporrectodeae subsp. tuberculatae]|uniref:phage virion morphogenesis protein n=1 Tax=Verminephrobacter aporrectodeae TaxID=1110389 RepID=UPI0022383D38|nr:phage virion morphogenesis protein [Verminephrobacter aporrectodeae]MCW5223512.1 phage virion morphogenesis protein [Verminephrobacter aporrectodeae subsp. tuberculatae]MCW5288977.1 phage virion morphogenesis protein [Verminephrobacter aporrectodeae subsp. tuberculatae]